MGRRHPAVHRQADLAGMVPVPRGQLHILLIRRVSNIDHGLRNGLTQSAAITALSSVVSVTESSVMLPPYLGEYDAPYQPKACLRATLQRRRTCRIATPNASILALDAARA
jgi:hypothetical protein